MQTPPNRLVRCAARSFIGAGLLLSIACDPVYDYRVSGDGVVAGGSGRPTYTLAGPEHTQLTVRALQFTISLDAEIEVTNVSGDPLTVTPNTIEARDDSGKPLVQVDSQPRVDCLGQPVRATVSLKQGESCVIHGRWRAPLDPPMSHATLGFTGLQRDAQPITLLIPLERVR